jgi:hypothetical protein
LQFVHLLELGPSEAGHLRHVAALAAHLAAVVLAAELLRGGVAFDGVKGPVTAHGFDDPGVRWVDLAEEVDDDVARLGLREEPTAVAEVVHPVGAVDEAVRAIDLAQGLLGLNEAP